MGEEDRKQQRDLILPGSHSMQERFRQLDKAGFTEEDGEGNRINPHLDPRSAQAKKDIKRFAPKGR